jgi:hypothetical protein
MIAAPALPTKGLTLDRCVATMSDWLNRQDRPSRDRMSKR